MGLNGALSTVDISEIPVIALRPRTRSVFSQLLNGIKVIPSPEQLPRDWRGLAHLTGVDYSSLPSNSHSDHVKLVLGQWEKKKPSPNIKELLDFCARLDRWDVLDDTLHLIDEDIKEYMKRKAGTAECERDRWKPDAQILTVDDTYRIEQKHPPQYYDAFLLYAYEDEEYAMQIVDVLENTHNCKLCLKDRDLVGGLLFEHDAIMQLIAERCNKLIIIISEAFLNSQFNKFFVTFAQALGIEQGQRKIIPCIFKYFNLPHQLRHYCSLNFERNIPNSSIWDRLVLSVTRNIPPKMHATIQCRSPLELMAPPENNETTNELDKFKTLDHYLSREQKSVESKSDQSTFETTQLTLTSETTLTKCHLSLEVPPLKKSTPVQRSKLPHPEFPDVPLDPPGGSSKTNIKGLIKKVFPWSRSENTVKKSASRQAIADS